MAIRSILFGVILGVAQTLAVAGASAAEAGVFEVTGLKLGATADEIEAAAKKSKLTDIDIMRGPSFEQAVMMAQRITVPARDYAGVQTIRARGQTAEAQVSFVPTPDGPRAVKIVYDVMPGGVGTAALKARLLTDHGEPDQRNDREWIWGDTAVFYSRKSAYLEFRPNPVSAGARQPTATMILADPALQKHAQEAIASEAEKGS